MKSLEEIRQAVINGHTVHWKNGLYKVINSQGELLIFCISNGSCVGIPDSIEYPNYYNLDDFYIGQEKG